MLRACVSRFDEHIGGIHDRLISRNMTELGLEGKTKLRVCLPHKFRIDCPRVSKTSRVPLSEHILQSILFRESSSNQFGARRATNVPATERIRTSIYGLKI